MTREPLQRTYAFARLLAGLLFLTLLASMSIIAVVGSFFARKSVRELSDRIVEQTLGRVELRIEALLQQAMTENAQGRALLGGGQLDPRDFKQLGGFFAHSLEVLPDLSSLGFGLESSGDYLFAERQPEGTIRVREYVDGEDGQRVVRDWRWTGAERALLKVSPWDGYDPRKRPFYEEAKKRGAGAWTETYPFWQGNERGAIPGVTYATPLYDAAGALVGVVNSDFELEALCRFLAEVRGGMDGYAFVLERRKGGEFRVIAHPDPAMLASEGAAGDGAAAAATRDPRAAAFIGTFIDEDAATRRARQGRTFLFDAEGESFFGSARIIEREARPPWAVGVVIPVGTVMAGVYRNDRWAFWTGLACLALTAAAAMRLARRVAEPLKSLAGEARAIGRLELDPAPEAESKVEEVADLARSMTEMKSSLRSFQKFVPADVVKEIVTTATEARLGGRRAELTFFFSDVAGFTSISEAMTPEALVAHMGEYLEEMSAAILGAGGTIDKFIGDGIMAFWGAPRENPRHAEAACGAALACQRALARLRVRWRAEGKPELRARIGLHTGAAIVGNIGSQNRLNYTAIGDSVNVTSRLEGLGKSYGTEILIGEPCAAAAGAAILARPVDRVSVKGRAEGIVVLELLAMAADATEEQRTLARATEAAFARYLAGDLAGALEGYGAVLALAGGDPVARVMAERCEAFLREPPAGPWNPTRRMSEK